jgi:hypothetical protein
MSAEVVFYSVAAAAVALQGLSKGGFIGLSALSMPMLALVVSPVKGAAILLPILVMQDAVSVWSFRHDFSTRNLAILMPPSVLGVGAGWLLAAHVSEDAVRLTVGGISVLFVVYMIARDRLGLAPVENPNVPAGAFWGVLAGFTSMISHAGSPPFQVYVMPQHLPPRTFAGTSTMFFAFLNLVKLVPYAALGQFSRDNLAIAAWLAPCAVISTGAGVWLVHRVAADRFYAIVLALTFLAGLKLVYDAALALWL